MSPNKHCSTPVLPQEPAMSFNDLPGLRPTASMAHVCMAIDRRGYQGREPCELLDLTLEAPQPGGRAARLLWAASSGTATPECSGLRQTQYFALFPSASLYEVNLSTWRAEAVGVDEVHCFLTASVRVGASQLDDSPPKAAPPTLCHLRQARSRHPILSHGMGDVFQTDLRTAMGS